jgi:hypothetical protein
VKEDLLMNLIDILTSPVIIIAIIWIVGKMLMRGRQSNQQPSNQPNPKLNPMHPKHFDMKSARSQMEDIYKQVKAEAVQQDMTVNQHHEPSTIAYKGSKVSENLYESKKSNQSSREITKTKLTTSKHMPVRKSTLVEGIIWSEILGPPRAYKKWSSK